MPAYILVLAACGPGVPGPARAAVSRGRATDEEAGRADGGRGGAGGRPLRHRREATEQYLRLRDDATRTRRRALSCWRGRCSGRADSTDVVDLLDKRAELGRRDARARAEALPTGQARVAVRTGRVCRGAGAASEDFSQRLPGQPVRGRRGAAPGQVPSARRAVRRGVRDFRRAVKTYPDAPEAPDNLLDWAGALIELGRRDEAPGRAGEAGQQVPGERRRRAGPALAGQAVCRQRRVGSRRGRC